MLHAQTHRGFTLIELLVVIFIIGVLSSIMLAGGGSQLAKARDSEKITDMQELALAFELYYNSCRQYPEPEAGNDLTDPTDAALALTTNNGCSGSITLGDFMRTMPSTEFEYTTNGDTSNHSDYVLQTTLERKDKVLQDDIDGTVYGVDCSDSTTFYYCVQP